jgi:3-methyladenine DNA glycosylase AlkD
MPLKDLQQQLNQAGSPARAKVSQWFFKTGKGEYGEGDVFIGIPVPVLRQIAHQHLELTPTEIQKLLQSRIHEYRFAAVEILVEQFERAKTKAARTKIAKFYLANKSCINNWDLVDASAEFILGPYALATNKDFIWKLAKSKIIWDRRIAILTTFHFIKLKQYQNTLKLAEELMNDKHDLIQKALGWMLREIGKRDEAVLTKFLNRYSMVMPRTMLRYAIERLTSAQKRLYMAKK